MDQALSEVKKTLVYERSAGVADLLADMSQLQSLDRSSEALQLWVARFAWLLLFAGLVGTVTVVLPLAFAEVDMGEVFPVLQVIFMALFLGLIFGLRFFRARDKVSVQRSEGSWWIIALFAAGGVAIGVGLQQVIEEVAAVLSVTMLVAGVVVWFVYQRQTRLNLEDRRYEVVAWALEMLSVDIAPTVPVEVRLVLSPADAKSKLQSTAKGRNTVNRYVDPWLTLSGRMLDGTKFCLRWVEKVTTKTRIKRKGRVKKKRTAKSSASLLLAFKPEKHQDLKRIGPAAKKAVQLPRFCQLTRFQPSDSSMLLKVSPGSNWWTREDQNSAADVMAEPSASAREVVAMMFLSLYQVLNLSRAIGKSTKGAG